MKPEVVEGLASAVNHWLTFQKLCGRMPLMSEHYLSQPIGEYLLYHHDGEVDAEVDHPNFNPDDRKGRPRQIDFCLFSKEKRRLTTAFELKWVGATPTDKQRVVDDILRLEALRIPEGQHVLRYFVIAGETSNYGENFQEAEANTNDGGRIPFFDRFFSFSSDTAKTVKIESLPEPQKSACYRFAKKYETKLPRTFTTTLVYNRKTRDNFKVGIWRISSAKNRALYKPNG